MQRPTLISAVRAPFAAACHRATSCGTCLTVGALLLLACVTSAAQTPGIYEIPADSPINVHDGSLSDWHAVVPGPAFRLVDLTATDHTIPLLNPPDSLDMELDIYLGWTAEPPRIYAAFDMRDDVFVTSWAGDPMPYGVQNVTLGIDADREGGFYVHHGSLVEWGYEYGQVWRILFAQGSDRAGEADFLLYPGDGSTRWLCAAPWSALGGWIDAEQQRALVELMATPFDEIPRYATDASGSVLSTLARGDTVGLYLSLVDYDLDSEDLTQQLDVMKSWWLPDVHTYLQLDSADLSPTVPVCLLGPWYGRTSVEPSSWGQVKQGEREATSPESSR